MKSLSKPQSNKVKSTKSQPSLNNGDAISFPYLTHGSLGTLLRTNLPKLGIAAAADIHSEFPRKSDPSHKPILDKYGIPDKVSASGFRFDFAFDTGKELILVEFQGYRHYADFRTVKRDVKKKNLWLSASDKVKIVEIPFFLRLTPESSEFLFGTKFNNFTIGGNDLSKFPHGFISKEAKEYMVPASFCMKGHEAYESFMAGLPKDIRKEILKSLEEIEKSGVECEWIY